MSWIPLSGGITSGNLTYWALPPKRRHGSIWVYMPGFPAGVSGSLFLGLGDGLIGVPDQVGSAIAKLTTFARIFQFDMPRLEDPVLGARLEIESGIQPVLLPSFQFFESVDIAWGESMPWRFSQFEPPIDLMWWETDSDGLPIFEWPWKWNATVNRWVSSRTFVVSGSGGGSGNRSGNLTDEISLGAANIFIEKIDYQFYLDTAVSAVNWLLEVRESDAGFVEQTWDSINLSGAPLRTTRYLSKSLPQLRARPISGWKWKVTPVAPGGSFDFRLQIMVRQVRGSI